MVVRNNHDIYMTDDESSMSRRTVLKASAIGVLVAGGVGGGLIATTGDAAAASTNIETNGVSDANPDGDVTEVYIEPSGSIEWKNFDEDVDTLYLKVESRVKDKDGNVIAGWRTASERTFDLGNQAGLSGSLSTGGFDKITLYGDGAGDTAPFDVADDGATVRRIVKLRITVELRNGENLADPGEKARMVEQAGFYADSTNQAATAGFTAEANGGMD